MTTILAIATATAQVGVAVSGGDGAAASITVRAGRRHGETLAPAIRAITELTGRPLSTVEVVAVDSGPGLFTGLRVGVATAKALGAALQVPVVACSSLDLLAHPHRHLRRPVASLVDARRGEVFWALYEPVGADTPGDDTSGGAAMVAVTDAAVRAPLEVAADLASVPDVLLVGDGARRYFADGGLGQFDVAPPEYDHPAPTVLAELAPGRPALPADKITPTYLRGADVRIGWAQR